MGLFRAYRVYGVGFWGCVCVCVCLGFRVCGLGHGSNAIWGLGLVGFWVDWV